MGGSFKRAGDDSWGAILCQRRWGNFDGRFKPGRLRIFRGQLYPPGEDISVAVLVFAGKDIWVIILLLAGEDI